MACAAMNCKNRHPEFKMKRFPADPTIRKIWIHNCGRKQFKPTSSSFICEAHFENCQFEPNREGGRKLRKNAIPTLFDVPNPLKKFKTKPRNSIYTKVPNNSNEDLSPFNGSETSQNSTPDTNSSVSCTIMNEDINDELNSIKIAVSKLLHSQSKCCEIENRDFKDLYEKLLSYVDAKEAKKCDINCPNGTTAASRAVAGEICLLRQENAQLRSCIQQYTKFIENNSSDDDTCTAEIIQNIDREIDLLRTNKTNLKNMLQGLSPADDTQTIQNVKEMQDNLHNLAMNTQFVSKKLNIMAKPGKSSLELELENEALRSSLEALKGKFVALEKQLASFSSFLDADQLKALNMDKIPSWSSESIIKGLKLRFALGVHGYKALLDTGYPSPSYTTLRTRLASYKISDGVFTALEEPIKKKVADMDQMDKFCAISIDKMEISAKNDYDKNEKKFIGSITLPMSTKSDKKKDAKNTKEDELGNHIISVLVRGIASSWKQVIAMGITGDSTSAESMHHLVENCVKFLEDCGLYVVALTSNMGSANRAYWTSQGIRIKRDGDRINYMSINGHNIYIVPDPCHLLKRLRCSMLGGTLKIPDFLQESHGLPSSIIGGHHIRELWQQEVDEKKEIRTLRHLTSDDLYPNNFKKMHVGSAVRFFSTETAAALELAVKNKQLHEDALTTAWFIQKIEQWFSLVSSRQQKTSITKNNRNWQFFIIDDIIDIFQHLEIRGIHWKPLNYGMILATLSLHDICQFLFANGFHHVLLSRFSQDALQNVFSQLRRRCGKTPSALQCRRTMKLITVSQFISKIERTSYHSDADVFLVDFFTKKGKEDRTNNRNSTALSVSPIQHQATLPNDRFMTVTNFESIDAKLFCSFAGIVTDAVLKKKICDTCRIFLCSNLIEEPSLTAYITMLNKGCLTYPNANVYILVCNVELIYMQNRNFILRTCSEPLIRRIVDEIDIYMPHCCLIKRKIVEHFFKIRSFAVGNFQKNMKRKKCMFDTSTEKKRKV